MSAKWIDAEDKLLRQLTSIGLNAKQIHSTYSTLLQGRSVKAIEQRLCYLNKPAEQRRQDDMASMDDVDRLIEAIDSVNTIRNDQKNILGRMKDKNKQTERR